MIRDPSSGGIGIRLNMAILMLMNEANDKHQLRVVLPAPRLYNNLLASIRMIAITRLEAGPASAVIAKYSFWFLKWRAFTGTGFAYPNPKRNIVIVPHISKCFMGFKDILPAFLPVGSPSFHAVQACALS